MESTTYLVENLRTLMRARGLSENQLGEKSGVPQPTINRILRGESKDPRDSTIAPLAKFLGVSVQELKHHRMFDAAAEATAGITAAAEMHVTKGPRRVKVAAFPIRAVDGEDGVDPETDVLVPVYDIEVSAGGGTIVPEFVETKYRLPYQIGWLKSWNAGPEDILIAKVRGDSMEPVLYDGDKVVIHRGITRVIDDCTYALIYDSNGATESRVKKLFRLPNDMLLIASNNPDKTRYPHETVHRGAVHILGRVIDKMGSGGL